SKARAISCAIPPIRARNRLATRKFQPTNSRFGSSSRSPLSRNQSRINRRVFARRSAPAEIARHPISLHLPPDPGITVSGGTALDRTHQCIGLRREKLETGCRAVG